MSNSLEDAKKLIASCVSIDDFKTLVGNTSWAVRNATADATYLLYSSLLPNGVKPTEIVPLLRERSIDSNGLRKIVSLSDTHVGLLVADVDARIIG